jgi:hypothetical protein
MIFLLKRTVNQVVEMLVLQLHEGWLILNQELRRLGEPTLPKDWDYENLDRIRDKMVGHKVANSLNPQNLAWYQKEFGSYEKMFTFLQKVADKIENRIDELLEAKKLNAQSRVSVIVEKEFTDADVQSLVNALKSGGVW